MNAAELPAHRRIAMTRGSILRIEDGLETTLRVEVGAVWLTQEGDARDYYLGAGESLRLDRDGLAIAHATRRAVLALAAPAPAPLGARLLRFWAGLFEPRARPTTAAL